ESGAAPAAGARGPSTTAEEQAAPQARRNSRRRMSVSARGGQRRPTGPTLPFYPAAAGGQSRLAPSLSPAEAPSLNQNPTPQPPPRSGEGEKDKSSDSPLRFGEGLGVGFWDSDSAPRRRRLPGPDLLEDLGAVRCRRGMRRAAVLAVLAGDQTRP